MSRVIKRTSPSPPRVATIHFEAMVRSIRTLLATGVFLKCTGRWKEATNLEKNQVNWDTTLNARFDFLVMNQIIKSNHLISSIHYIPGEEHGYVLRPGDVTDVVVRKAGVEGHEGGLPGRRVGAGAPEVHELGEPQVEGGIPVIRAFPPLGSLL